MKTRRLPPPAFLLAAVLPFFISGCATMDQSASAQAAAVKTAQLVIAIQIPPTWRPFLADDLSEAFSERVETVFRSRGYTGKMIEQDDLSLPAATQSLLTIFLDEWKVDHIGNVVCTFRATIQTGSEPPHGLGYFRSTELRMMHGIGRWGLADSFGSAADDAIHDLYRKLADAHLLPDPPASSPSASPATLHPQSRL